MSDEASLDLVSRLVDGLKSSGGLSAQDLSRALGVPRNVVNSALYRHSGSIFRRSDSKIPVWSLLELNSAPHGSVDLASRVTRRIAGEVLIRISGVTWGLTIQVAVGSRNDPIYRVEASGPNSRVITVNDQVISEDEKLLLESRSGLADSVLAVAASALVWEIHWSSSQDEKESLDPSELMSVIFRKLGASNVSDEVFS